MSTKINLNKIKKLFLELLLVTTLFSITRFAVRSVEVSRVTTQEQNYWGIYANTTILQRFLGLRIVAADLLWIDLLYKSDLTRGESLSPFFKVMKSIQKLDPQNFLSFWFGGLYLSVVKDDIRGASMLFRDAVLALEQNAWVDKQLKGSIYFAYGYHLMFEEHDFDTGAKYILLSAQVSPQASLLSKMLAESMSTEKGIVDVGFRVLNDFYRRAQSTEARLAIELKMKRLLARRELVELNEQFSEYLLRTDASLIPRPRALQVFLRSINHKDIDILGNKLTLDSMGKISVKEP